MKSKKVVIKIGYKLPLLIFFVTMSVGISFGMILPIECNIKFPLAEPLLEVVNCNGAFTAKYDGTYYLKRDYVDEVDKNTYFDLQNGTWKDEGGNRGEYQIDGDEITLYVGNGGLAFASGTISDGKLRLKIGSSTSTSTLTYIKQ